MPKIMVFGLMDIDRYAGEPDKSTTLFSRHNLEFFELSLNNDILYGYPLEMKGTDSINFYHRFLENTFRLDNSLCSTVITQKSFEQSNFLIVHNFGDLENEQGHLNLKIKFKNALTQKLMLLYMPVCNKTLHFDNNYNIKK